MDLQDFHIGDRVVMVHPEYSDRRPKLVAGSTGLIRSIVKDLPSQLGVEWDDDIGGHELDCGCTSGHGWWVKPQSCELEVRSELPEPASQEELFSFLGF